MNNLILSLLNLIFLLLNRELFCIVVFAQRLLFCHTFVASKCAQNQCGEFFTNDAVQSLKTIRQLLDDLLDGFL